MRVTVVVRHERLDGGANHLVVRLTRRAITHEPRERFLLFEGETIASPVRTTV